MRTNSFMKIVFAAFVGLLAGCQSGVGDSENPVSDTEPLTVELFCESSARGILCEAMPIPRDGAVDVDAYTYDWTTSGDLSFSGRIQEPTLREIICLDDGAGSVRVTVTSSDQLLSADARQSVRCGQEQQGATQERQR